jgi:hypothetical protein
MGCAASKPGDTPRLYSDNIPSLYFRLFELLWSEATEDPNLMPPANAITQFHPLKE